MRKTPENIAEIERAATLAALGMESAKEEGGVSPEVVWALLGRVEILFGASAPPRDARLAEPGLPSAHREPPRDGALPTFDFDAERVLEFVDAGSGLCRVPPLRRRAPEGP